MLKLRLLLVTAALLVALPAPAALADGDGAPPAGCEGTVAEREQGGDDACEDETPKPEPKPEPEPCPDDDDVSERTEDGDECETAKPPRRCDGLARAAIRRQSAERCPPAEEGARKPPRFRKAFLNRVWRFEGLADFFEEGVLGMTIERVRGLPRKLRNQDDPLLDQDALVLVGPRTKVFAADGSRTTAAALADADAVRVHGKLLPPKKWRQDEDGQDTPTLRAKRIHVLPAATAAG